MAILFKTQKSMALKCPYESRHVAKQIGGKWNQETKTWDFPISISVAKQLGQRFSDLCYTHSIQEMLEMEEAQAQVLTQAQAQSDATLQVSYAHKLRDYQRVGVNFLTTAKRAILADEMGIGKTVQAITACEEVEAKKVLIVCPNSLKWNWHNEVEMWTGKEATIIQGPKAKRQKQIAAYTQGYLVINYESLRLHPELAKKKWDVLICDEAHKLKNRKTQQTKAVKDIKADRIFLLTGTPMLNRAEELYSLLNRLYPEKYSSFWRFVDQFCQQHHNGFGVEIRPGTEAQIKALRNEIQPIMLRRVKKDVLTELPDKVYVRHVVELEGKQRAIYNRMHKEAMTIIEDELVAAPVVIAQITRLRQIAVSPQLINEEAEGSAKIDALLEMLENNMGEHKIAVFSQFRKAIELVGSKLTEKGIKWVSVTGAISHDDRQANTEAFQNDPDTRIMLATIEAAGLGLTWTSADIAVFLDQHWTPAINRQAEDRLHRYGQRNSVTIIKLIAKDTIEEQIENLLDEKQHNSDMIIEKPELLFKLLEAQTETTQ